MKLTELREILDRAQQISVGEYRATEVWMSLVDLEKLVKVAEAANSHVNDDCDCRYGDQCSHCWECERATKQALAALEYEG